MQPLPIEEPSYLAKKIIPAPLCLSGLTLGFCHAQQIPFSPLETAVFIGLPWTPVFHQFTRFVSLFEGAHSQLELSERAPPKDIATFKRRFGMVVASGVALNQGIGYGVGYMIGKYGQ